jgi:1-acyl-sn-glycerol-3-phosphate acyltransferase
MRLPPKWVRRIVFAPLVVAITVFIVVFEPVWLLVALVLTSLVPGRFRLPRVVFLATVYLVWDSLVLLAALVLWIASGFGFALRRPAFVRAHYALGAWALKVLFWVVGWVLRLQIVTEGEADHPPGGDGGSPETSAPADPVAARAAFAELFSPGTPLVVASRHGGPGDSFILVHTLLNAVGREPRIVLKDTLQWDPAIDVLLNRIPTRFITPTGFAGPRKSGGGRKGGGVGVEQQIADLAGGLDADDALVIFPEGGQVSVTRRASRIARLRRSGRDRLAERAERLRHVMPPQPGGVFAALDAAPDADVVLIGHTGLDRLRTLGDIWRELPMDKRLTMRAWRVARDEIPTDREEQAEWLFAWFERIDRWIDARSPIDAEVVPRHQ